MVCAVYESRCERLAAVIPCKISAKASLCAVLTEGTSARGAVVGDVIDDTTSGMREGREGQNERDM